MTASSGRTRVYVAASDSAELFTLQLDTATGDLTALDTIVLRDGAKLAGACPMALSPDGRHLYFALRSEPYAVLSFAIDPGNGGLNQTGEAPLPHSMAFISTDNTGRWLFGASYPGNLLSVSPINGDGIAGPVRHVVPARPNAHAVRADPSNRFVLNTSLGGDVVQQHRFDVTTGALTPNEPPFVSVRSGAGPRHFVFHPDGRRVYLLNELDASVYVFAYDAGRGTLSELQTVDARPPGFTEPPAAADIHATPDGRFLYASVRNTSTLAAYAIDAATGLLTLAGHFDVPRQPRGFAIDPSGRYLLCAGQLSHTLAVYEIDAASGRLTKLNEQAMGRGPNWVEVVGPPTID
jgi:6-phosphogluconolactonase